MTVLTDTVKPCIAMGMTLEDFRKQQKLTYKQLAELLGASHATVARRWCLGIDHKDRMIPAPDFMERIVLVTDGSVMPSTGYMVKTK